MISTEHNGLSSVKITPSTFLRVQTLYTRTFGLPDPTQRGPTLLSPGNRGRTKKQPNILYINVCINNLITCDDANQTRNQKADGHKNRGVCACICACVRIVGRFSPETKEKRMLLFIVHTQAMATLFKHLKKLCSGATPIQHTALRNLLFKRPQT